MFAHSGFLSCITLFAAAVLVPARVQCQSGADPIASPASFRFFIGGGFAEGAPFTGAGVGDIGYNFSGAVERRTRLPGLRLHTDAFFANWGSDQHVAAVSAGLALHAPDRWRIAPAVIATTGVYRTSRVDRMNPGWSLGAGLRVPLGERALLLESRIHAFDVGERGLAASGVSPQSVKYDRWQYTYTPLTFSIEF
jgi:hypothetical protein